MNLVAVSGSVRGQSTNTALLKALGDLAPAGVRVTFYERLGELPIFSSDREVSGTPAIVEDWAEAICSADGLIIASPEYARGIPGGLKNAIDWLVSRDEIALKPIYLLHASHRGDDALSALRLILSTVSQNFAEDIFERFELVSMSPAEIKSYLQKPEVAGRLENFLERVIAHVGTVVPRDTGRRV